MDIPFDTSLKRDFIDAERCIAELQRGRAIAFTDATPGGEISITACRMVQLVESLSTEALKELMASHACQLILSRPRALALDLLVDSNAVCLDLEPQTSVEMVRDWAGLNPESVGRTCQQASTRLGGLADIAASDASDYRGQGPDKTRCARAALNLAHHAHVLPAFIMYASGTVPEGTLSVLTDTAIEYADQSGKLMKLSTASIPLSIAEQVELTVFREQHGNAEHVAITVGQPDFSDTVTVRVHSSCFTGDILGSMKCDCGEQLEGAISSMAASGGGVVLYISQEGRGIGLASKLLAYQLQDKGLDTIEANQHLGFGADERSYKAAVVMLEQLGIESVRLMTNNPLKIEALRHHGVQVVGRVPAPATVNTHNARYLQTKRDRAGHMVSCDTAG